VASSILLKGGRDAFEYRGVGPIFNGDWALTEQSTIKNIFSKFSLEW
jgi:hypothetical protein